ncbi:RDD family protein [Campylobacter taeniopygiae]|uniref:RDD family protein n=1 Tax=Campylobacter taeniopygiae TaxID=2510188 RepID=UPI003D6B08B7
MKEDLATRLERENLSIASFKKRVLAYFIDNFILSFIIYIIFYTPLSQAKDLMEMIEVSRNFSFSFILIHLIYQIIFTYLYGASLGKMISKIIILDEDLLDKPNLIQSCIRASVSELSNSAFFLGFAWALGNDLRKTWEDYAAKTVVVNVA